MSGSQQWSSDLSSSSSQQQVFPRSAQAVGSFTHSVNVSSQEQQMIQPLNVNSSFNANSVNAAPFYPKMQFQPYQTLMSSQGVQPFQVNGRPVSPSSSQSAAQGDHQLVGPYGYTPVTSVQVQGEEVNGRNGVWLYPSQYQVTQVGSGQPQSHQMVLQNGHIGNNQTITAQTSSFFSGDMTSQRAVSASSSQQGEQAKHFGEAPANPPLSRSKYQGVQNKHSPKEPTKVEASLKSQNGALLWQLSRKEAEIKRLQNDCHLKGEMVTNLRVQSDKHVKELKKLKDRKTKNISRGQFNLTKTAAEEVSRQEIQISRLRAVIKGQREEIERLNILFSLHNVSAEDTASPVKERTTALQKSKQVALRGCNEDLAVGSLSSKYCNVNLDIDDATERNE